MVDPVKKWQPVTDFYKEQQAAQPVDPEAERQQKLREIHEQVKRTGWREKKAPIGIRVLTWYLFLSAGFYTLLLIFLAVFPHTSVATWVVSNIAHSLPGAAAREQADQEREELRKEAALRGYTLPDYIVGEEKTPEQIAQEQREFVMVYSLIVAVLTSVVGFMWLNRSWKVRWVAMFYAGARVAKAGVAFLAIGVSGANIHLPPEVVSAAALGIGVNILIFCYLAFWPGVEEWFKEEA